MDLAACCVSPLMLLCNIQSQGYGFAKGRKGMLRWFQCVPSFETATGRGDCAKACDFLRNSNFSTSGRPTKEV